MYLDRPDEVEIEVYAAIETAFQYPPHRRYLLYELCMKSFHKIEECINQFFDFFDIQVLSMPS